MGQQEWLTDRTLVFRGWQPLRPGWDHDHCVFCQAEIAAENEHVQFTAGYVTADDNYSWICTPCFEDFKTDFRWTVVQNDARR